ncbi:GtrA family protein [Paenibacillus sp. Marseille-Q4541]|uniref:GtrA family protein n=1 Tax=Paenibacillus sp. Marseille-Q4541 TaxID=2831522 RepID=UPI001BA69097|nr:GtrA family protein [Paenibacillus sp. Marseille-Q4541]
MKRAVNKGSFFRFSLVGMLNTAVDLGVFFLLSLSSLSVVPAQVVSYVVGMLNSYLWNRRWTFASTQHRSFGELIRFISLSIITLMISVGTLHVAYYYFGIPLFTSKLLATLCSVLVNYVGSALWVFEQLHEQAPPLGKSKTP